MSLNRTIRKVARMMDELGLTEITSEISAFWGILTKTIHLSKQKIISGTSDITDLNEKPNKAKETSQPTVAAPKTDAITSPMVGVVYLSPEPTAKPFIEIGKTIKAGATICLIEAMKTFNPIKASKSGVITQILVKDGQTVEFGTALVVIK